MYIKAIAAVLVVLALGGVASRYASWSTPGVSEPAQARVAAPDAPGRFPHPRRVALVMLENRSYGQVIGNRAAPFLNRLARTGALERRAYAITHPSLPNYVALTTGSTNGIQNDCSTCDIEGPNLVNQLTRKGISWKAYFQSIPHTGSAVIRKGDYSAHYNPFTYSTRIRADDPSTDRIVSFGALHHDLAGGSLPRFSWISPDLAHDGHDNSVASTDRYASRLVPRVLRALGPRGLLYLTWDEGKRADHRGLHGTGGGHVPLITAGPMARHHAVSRLPVDQYALLRSIQAGFDLPRLGHAADRSTPLLTGLVN